MKKFKNLAGASKQPPTVTTTAKAEMQSTPNVVTEKSAVNAGANKQTLTGAIAPEGKK